MSIHRGAVSGDAVAHGDHADHRGDDIDRACDRGRLTRRELLVWVGDRLAGGVPVFVEAALMHVRGALDRDRFLHAVRATITESDALTTGFREVEGWPCRVDAGASAPAIDVLDLVHSSAPERVLRDVARERVWSCGGGGRLVDALLVRLAPEHHAWLLVQHQLVSDAWSFRLVHQRVLEHYRFAAGRASRLPDPPPPFEEYRAYERRARASRRADEARAYWQRSYAGDGQRAVGIGGSCAGDAAQIFRIVRPLGSARSAAIRAQATANAPADVGIFVAFASGVVGHVYHTTGSREVVLDVPFANRPTARFKSTIGSFMNVCPMRIPVEPDDRVGALRDRIMSATWEAAQHQGYAARAGAVPQPYDVLVNVHRSAVAAASFDACALDVEWVDPTHRLGAASIAVHDFGATGELTLVVDLNEASFAPASRREFVASLLATLDAQLADPTSRIRDYAPAVRVARPAAASTVWARFSEQARQTPTAIALRTAEGAVTYRELHERACAVAADLAAHDVAREAMVAVLGARGVAWLAAMLGVWCRGAVYLPIEPRWPRARIAHVLDQTEARVVIGDGGARGGARACEPDALARPWFAVRVDGSTDTVDETPAAPEGLAYVAYTSGSSGTPKGALIEHRGLANHVDAKIALLGLDAWDGVAQTAGAGFDVHLWQCLAPLLVGARIELFGDDVVRNPAALCGAIAERRVTVLELVPALLEVLLETDERGTPSLGSLRWLIATGEALSPELCRRWLRRYPQIPVVNAYGPTECADDVTHHVIRTPLPRDAVRVPIGRAIPGMTVHIVDETLRPAPVGAIGEICVGGVGVGRGYVGGSERSAAAFVVPDPFDARPGSRLYRTGDLGRCLPDGTLEWHGRRDAQVKIRGVRVEPEEIEAVLREHPAVAQAVVHMDRVRADGGSRLIAHVVMREESTSRRDGDDGASSAADVRQVAEWRRLWDDAYRKRIPRVAGASPETVGWTSRYTRVAIPPAEMREWLDTTVARILSLQPRRVLEIGCGSGMLLSRVAPHCTRYLGTDLSAAAIDYVVREHLASNAMPQVTVRHAAAHDLACGGGETFDTVVLNSVAQYFPSVDYLLRVLRAAVGVIGERGSVFVGDVRALPLAHVLHTSLELARAVDDCTVRELRARVARGLAQENELLLDPRFFSELARISEGPCSVVTQLKRGRNHNELTRFRFDVTWSIGVPFPDVEREVQWETDITVAAIRDLVLSARGGIAIRGVKNLRLQTDDAMATLVDEAADGDTIAELWRAFRGGSRDTAIDPEDLWEIEAPWAARVSIETSAVGPDRFDVVVRPAAAACAGRRATMPAAPVPPAAPKWRGLANDPRRRGMAAGSRLDEVRNFLRERLPEELVPSVFVALDALPLDGNGKVDRGALQIGVAGRCGTGDGEGPRSEVERILVAIWERSLGTTGVGRYDDFFALGGDSLSVYRMLLEVHAALGVEIAPATFLIDPTVAGLGAALDVASDSTEGGHDREGLLADLEALTDDEAAALLAADDPREAHDA